LSRSWALVWLGGDASGYESVVYRLGGREAASVLAPAALASLLAAGRDEPEKLVVLVPETLFEGSHCDMYRLLVEAKTGYGGKRLLKNVRGRLDDVTRPDQLAHRLLERDVECVVVPHPGVASPLKLEARGGGYLVSYGLQGVYSASFDAMVNTVYAALRRLARNGLDLVVDLTHGTNLLVSAALLSAAMIKAVYKSGEAAVKAYMAPVLGRPGTDTRVEFIDVTPAVETVNTVAAGINAWMMLDERLLPMEAVRDIGRSLGPRYGRGYSSVKSLVEKTSELLWALRSGQVPVAPKLLRGLKRMHGEAEKRLEEMLSDRDALTLPAPWVPVADAAAVTAENLVRRLLKAYNVDTMIESAESLAEKGMPDKALGPARELVVALLLARQAEPQSKIRVGGDEWQKLETLLHNCARRASDSRGGQPRSRAGRSGLPLTDKELKSYERARSLRNRLMHGRLSREENVELIVTDEGDLEVVTHDTGKPLEAIRIENVKEVAMELITLLRRLRSQTDPKD